jgi:hypothetical protein
MAGSGTPCVLGHPFWQRRHRASLLVKAEEKATTIHTLGAHE